MLKLYLLIVLVKYSVPFLVNSLENFKPHIFVEQCIKENPDLPSTYVPYTLLSLCHLKNRENAFKQTEKINVKHIPRFSHHSFVIKFENILDVRDGDIFKPFYESLFVPSTQRDLFEYVGLNYREYWQNNWYEVKQELLRRRWNLDEFILQNSKGARDFLTYNEGQLPTFLQKEDKLFKTNNVSDLNISYYITSGYGQKCIHDSWKVKLASLTYDFTAYDRIFCDAFEYHGLQHRVSPYWNLYDMYYWRGRLVRDGLVSSFPPDTSHAVYYACPEITFVVLQRHPITWLFVKRPFSNPLWFILMATFSVLEFSRHLTQLIEYFHKFELKRKMIQIGLFAIIVNEDSVRNLQEILNRYSNMLRILNATLRIMLVSAYSGMILVGILHPLYPWTPSTFAELNSTNNYFVGTAEHSPYFIGQHLIDRHKLNKLPPEMLKFRKQLTPAEFLEYSESRNFTDQKENQDKFYAAIMFDDKMNLWTKGRFIIYQTAPFLDRIKPATKSNDQKVLPEIRYVSVAPGATRLHFLMTTLKRAFEAGTWMRWYYLEQNYYKNVAPIIAVKKIAERKMKRPEDPHKPKSLNIYQMFSVFAIEGFGLALSFFVCMFELYTTCSYSQII